MKKIRVKKAQAVLELAIFGSIILMLLGVILNYGMRYSLQQKTMMTAFRRALQGASTSMVDKNPISVSYLLIEDKHIPHPSNPFAVGSVIPFSSSASVTMNYKLHETPDEESELPVMRIQIGSQFKRDFKTAGFSIVRNLTEKQMDRYKEIFGDTNVWEIEKGQGICLEWETNPETGQEECSEYAKNIKIIDSCEGEIIDYSGCKRQCRLITDNAFCERECNRGKEKRSNKNCAEICSQNIPLPWYCENLDNLFYFAIAKDKPKAMGVQADYTKTTIINNVLSKKETAGSIKTTDFINWSDTTERKIVYVDKTDNTTRSFKVSNTISETDTLSCQNGVCN